jgi:hypothetical protein
MNSINEQQMNNILMRCAFYWPAAFKDKNDDLYAKMMTRAWADALNGYSYEEVVRAFAYLVRTSKFMPSVAEVIDTIENNGNDAQTAKEAYEHCSKLASRYGYCDEESALAEMNDVERAAIKEIGWYNFCTNEEPRPFKIKDFEARYDVHKERVRYQGLAESIQADNEKLDAAKKQLLEEMTND